MKQDTSVSYLTKAQLKERGWTDAAIKRFAGEPDSTETNPVYRSAASMLLYALERIKEIEAGGEFKEWVQQSQKRKEAARRGVDTKTALLLDQVKGIEIRVPQLPADGLLKQSIRHYNEYKEQQALERGWYDYTPTSKSSSPAFLSRIQVNYLRHEMTAYDEELAKVFGKVGNGEAYEMIREKVFEAIAVAYPSLAAECRRQLQDDDDGAT